MMHSQSKILVLTVGLTICFTASLIFSIGFAMTISENKQLIKNMFHDVFEDTNASEITYEKYFSKDYVQYVDGKTLNYDDFVNHMRALKSALKSAKITFKYIVGEGDKVATIHIAQGIKKNGGTVETQVNAFFQIKNNKIILCDELTRLIKGEETDKDLGSRQ